MIQQIFEAFGAELQELFIDTPGATVLRDTQFDQDETPSHGLPLIILSLGDSPDMAQMPGGATQATWNWIIRIYFVDSNAELSPDQAFSTGDYSLIETVVNHFNFQNWLTQAFKDVSTNYSYKLSFQDITKAPALQKKDGGIIPGYQITFSSIAIDTRTAYTVYSDVTLQNAKQVPLEGAALSIPVPTVNIAKANGSIGTFDIVSTTPWVILSIPPWCAVDKYEGNNTDTVTVTASLNSSTINRTGHIIVSAPLTDISDKTVTIIQTGV
jgi:hypothetical protein